MARVKRQRGRVGTMLVEAAILLPVLILVTMAVIEWSWIFVLKQQIENGARHGARVAAREGSSWQEGLDATTDLLTTRYSLTTSDFTVEIDVVEGDWDSLETGTPFTVTVTMPYDGTDFEISNALIPVPTSLVSGVTMAREGP